MISQLRPSLSYPKKCPPSLQGRGVSMETNYYLPNTRPRPRPPRPPRPPPRPGPQPATGPTSLTARPGRTSKLGVALAVPHIPNPRPVLGPSPRGPVLSKPGIYNTSFRLFNRVKNRLVHVSPGGPDLLYATCQHQGGCKNPLES